MREEYWLEYYNERVLREELILKMRVKSVYEIEEVERVIVSLAIKNGVESIENLKGMLFMKAMFGQTVEVVEKDLDKLIILRVTLRGLRKIEWLGWLVRLFQSEKRGIVVSGVGSGETGVISLSIMELFSIYDFSRFVYDYYKLDWKISWILDGGFKNKAEVILSGYGMRT